MRPARLVGARSRRRPEPDVPRRAGRPRPREGAQGRRRRPRRATRGADAAPRRMADRGEEFDPTKRDWHRRGKPRRRRLRRRHRQWSAPRPSRKFLLYQWVGRRETRRGKPPRPPLRQSDRRFALRIGGGSFIIEWVGGIDSDDGFSITQGGCRAVEDHESGTNSGAFGARL